jgi:hypothetical protein
MRVMWWVEVVGVRIEGGGSRWCVSLGGVLCRV